MQSKFSLLYYNGHEIIKDNHVSAIVYNTEDTLEIAEITRKKMSDKMKNPECVTRKVKIAPHDYSKEKFLATFIPQKQLTPEHIFWSQDIIKLKSKALKEQTTVSRPIKALTVYPPNTPGTLVPRVLPTKSQVKIHIFTLIQLFLKFDKTCKKRITPTGLTEGKGVLNKPRNVISKRKHDAIERKNLLIANDNFAECLSKEVFSVATNSKLNVARLTEMHVANTIVEASCLKLEAELDNLRDKSHHDNQEELINRLSKLELKYQNLKDSFGNNKDTPDFDSVFVIGKMQASLQGKDNIIRQLKKQISQLQETHSDTGRTLKVRTTYFQITQLTEQVTNLQVQNDLFRAENDKIKQHYKELYDFIKITRAKHIEQVTALTTENVNMKAEILEKVVQIVLWYLDSGCSKHMTGDRSRLMNFVKKFIKTVRFKNDHFGAIMGYEDYVIGNSVISRVYYVEGPGHNLFSVGQFCDSDLEVAFRKHSCYVRDTDGVELIKGSRGSNLYIISIEDMMKSSPICLLSKASKNKSWLWHRRLNHLNFGTINDLARKDLVRG
nr:integrase, catalytic region, zinc finger, CCHC-type, peptidase aspartic, catalytic [Tanacetum cinerariifolium]